jgi:hypothetical protein
VSDIGVVPDSKIQGRIIRSHQYLDLLRYLAGDLHCAGCERHSPAFEDSGADASVRVPSVVQFLHSFVLGVTTVILKQLRVTPEVATKRRDRY